MQRPRTTNIELKTITLHLLSWFNYIRLNLWLSMEIEPTKCTRHKWQCNLTRARVLMQIPFSITATILKFVITHFSNSRKENSIFDIGLGLVWCNWCCGGNKPLKCSFGQRKMCDSCNNKTSKCICSTTPIDDEQNKKIVHKRCLTTEKSQHSVDDMSWAFVCCKNNTK